MQEGELNLFSLPQCMSLKDLNTTMPGRIIIRTINITYNIQVKTTHKRLHIKISHIMSSKMYYNQSGSVDITRYEAYKIHADVMNTCIRYTDKKYCRVHGLNQGLGLINRRVGGRLEKIPRWMAEETE